jgi:hypothetical protein
METFVWGVAVVAVVCLLQVPVTHWLSRYFEQDRAGAADPAAGLPATVDEYDRDPGTCPRCGLHNDAAFDYCANCLAPLFRLQR